MLPARTSAALACGLLVLAGCDPAPSSVAAARSRRVVDRAGLLDADGERRIRHYLDWVSTERGIDYQVVVDAAGGVPVEERASRLFAERGVGSASAGRGLLLVVDPEAQQVRVEVGYALEPVLTDVDASRMLADYLAPYFRSGEAAAGVEASIEALIAKIEPADGNRAAASGVAAGTSERAPAGGGAVASSRAAAATAGSGSGGAGASLDLLRRLPDGVLDEETKAALGGILVPQPDPRQARDLEIALLHRGIYLQEAALYDEAWRRAARPAGWSPARLREIGRQWDRPYEVAAEDGVAVAYYADAPALGPTFLRRTDSGWIIDASATARHVVYDYSNERWYLIDGDSEHVALLLRLLPLVRVTLQGGRAAWVLE